LKKILIYVGGCIVVVNMLSRSMQLLCIGHGYYLDGWLTVCWQVNNLGMYPTT